MANPILVTGAAGCVGARQGPLSVQEFVRKNAATFTASAKEARSKA